MTQIKYRNGSVQVSPSGELDQYLSMQLKKQIDEALRRYPHANNLDLNLEHITFMDSSGIGFLMGRYRQMKSRGGGVRLFGVSRQMDRLFRMSGLHQIADLTFMPREESNEQQ